MRKVIKTNKVVATFNKALTYVKSTNSKEEQFLSDWETKPYIPRRKPAEISQVELTAQVNKIQMI